MRILSTLLILLLVLAVFGWFRGWFVVDLAQASSSTHPRVVVDSQKVADDARAAANKIGELSSRAAHAIEGKASRGADGVLAVDAEVTAIDAVQRDLELKLGGDVMSLNVPSTTPITVAGEAGSFTSLRVGQKVHVELRADGDRLLLQRIDAK